MPTPTTHINVRTSDLREWLRIVEKASKAVHSDPMMHFENKRAVLSMLAPVKKGIANYCQLSLFSPAQRGE